MARYRSDRRFRLPGGDQASSRETLAWRTSAGSLLATVAFVLSGIGTVAATSPHTIERVAAPTGTSEIGSRDVATSLVANAEASLRESRTLPSGEPWTCHGLKALGTPACQGTHERPGGPSAGGGVHAQSSGSSHPPLQAAYDFELAYDAADGYVVLLGAEEGGSGSAGPGDMWKFQGGVWWQLHPDPMPQNCPGSALAYDDRDGYLVYFGGPNQGAPSIACSSGNQTWTYLAGVWTLLHPSSFPSPRFGAAMTNDSADGGLILFGGMSPGGALNGETWAFSSGTWSQVHPTTTPSARSEAGLAYDAADGYVLLFGGMDGGYPGLNDSWTYTGGRWTQLHPTVSPPYPEPDALSYVASDRVVLFTGAWNYSAGLPEVTWTFHGGGWSEVTSARPTERIGDQTVHDYSDGFTIMFGGSGYTDTWSFAAGVWTDLTDVVPTLAVPSFSVNPSVVVIGNRTTFTVGTSGGIPPYGYAFSGLPLGCTDANVSVLDCTPATWGFFAVTVTVTDGAGQATLATAQLEVYPPALRISVFEADPSTAAPGSLVTLSMALSGGAAPYTFAYQGLPVGCVSQNASSLTCRPAQNGSFEITVKVADSFGQQVDASTPLVVALGAPVPPSSSSPNILGLPPAVAYAALALGLIAVIAVSLLTYLQVQRARKPPPPRT